MAPTPPRELLRRARRPWIVGSVAIAATVALVAGLLLALPGGAASSDVATVSVTNAQCGGGMSLAHGGPRTFSVVNTSRRANEVLLENSSGGVVAGIAVLGPGTTVNMTADLGGGTYSFNCFSDAGQYSSTLRVSGSTNGAPGVQLVTEDMLIGPNDSYLTYAAGQLAAVATDVTAIEQALGSGNLAAARSEWLTAMTDWERVGASYDSFGADGEAVDGLPGGLAGGVNDPQFTGLHRLEYGLWHGQSASTLLPVAQALANNIGVLQVNLASDDVAGDPTNLPTRAHEILEDALRDHLSGIDDFGAGAEYAETAADLQVTRTVLSDLAPLIASRAPHLLPTADAQMNALQRALSATQVDGQWENSDQISQADHERVDAAIGALLQTLSAVPDLLQVAGTGAGSD
ncbi:MAG TPA: EfeM/EfeO family lipoprotein [Acidimicrobiales bacterium]|nr:EfeM/EfeO family lipoprotein [Acidimicrobiales bacterium]